MPGRSPFTPDDAAAGCRRCDDPAGAGADVHRRRGQERDVPAAYLAARRHGGPDARVGADPCRDDGRGGRLPRGADVPLFVGYAPEVLHWTAYVGAFTALYAAVVACVQSDIKRVLAFSTISQIGFMIVALGVCTSADPHTGGLGYMASMFHLFTHAMFKALLFLGAGASSMPCTPTRCRPWAACAATCR